MRPLLPSDPSAVGGHRLLGRLGSGGMGTVYLGRSPTGVLLAVKVIRADHAADPAFRERFRREAEAAGRLSGRWVVPVVAADPRAREPWLATPFVPGPALSEAVAGYGPLPVAAVRTLGARLAEALAEVHAAGLVHRDVKPGNILLAPDGPRLIDFGIARAAGAVTLTAADAVVGTPGYLAPEQARAGGPAPGPESDVFSLGCVLVYAATGRGPFGGGHAAAVVFRTVHDEPDLAAVPPELLPAVTACLARNPAGRPAPARLRALLGDVPYGSDAPGGGGEWLPGPLARLIAERSTHALELPAPEPTRLDAPPAGARPLTRRRLIAGAGMLVATGGPAGWFATRGGRRGSPPPPAGERPTLGLALQADLSGPGARTGRAHERGLRLAVDQHNARADAVVRLALRTADDGGDEARAAAAAKELIADPAVLAIVGPTWDGAVPGLAGACLTADLTLVLVSLNSAQPFQSQWRTLVDTRASADGIALPVLHYLSRVEPVSRTAVVEDSADGEPAWRLTRALQQSPPSQGTTSVHRIPAGGSDFAGAVRDLTRARAGAVVFAGTSPERAALLARALADAGFKGPRLGIGEAMAPAFLTAAGPAAAGWLFAAFFTDPLSVPGCAAFVAAHRAAYGEPPARWATEAYDVVGLVATALTGLAGEGRDRPGLSRRIFRVAHQGLAKPLGFDSTTHTLAGDRIAHLYRVVSGAFGYLGPYADVRSAP